MSRLRAQREMELKRREEEEDRRKMEEYRAQQKEEQQQREEDERRKVRNCSSMKLRLVSQNGVNGEFLCGVGDRPLLWVYVHLNVTTYNSIGQPKWCERFFFTQDPF